MNLIGKLVGVALFFGFIVLYTHIRLTGPDPYAQCDEKETETERNQCRSQIDFALSAGW